MVEEPYKLLIVDSIMALFRTDFTGRGELAERQQKLGQMMALLKKRLYLRKGKGEQRVAKVVDSPCLAEGEASFALSDDGVVEYKE
uniref:Rad51-like C-terminal domain-containing protein n=1 Tax=Tetradesmus obliquus TaxID=3088 RepID=A0A383W804_TETOB|eukprot:jgi/Sobl393_1/11706/SZX73561.1